MWSGRAQLPPLIVLLFPSWSLVDREMNLQLLSPRGWASSLLPQDHRGHWTVPGTAGHAAYLCGPLFRAKHPPQGCRGGIQVLEARSVGEDPAQSGRVGYSPWGREGVERN